MRKNTTFFRKMKVSLAVKDEMEKPVFFDSFFNGVKLSSITWYSRGYKKNR